MLVNKEWVKDFIRKYTKHPENMLLKGNELRASCPLPNHDDNNPSFSINIDTGKWNCLGCAQAGDIIALVVKVLCIDIAQAKKLVGRKNELSPDDVLRFLKRIYQDSSQSKRVKYRSVKLPPKAKSQQPFYQYLLRERNRQTNGKSLPYTGKQIITIKRTFGAYFCDEGIYRNRIICPILDRKQRAQYFTNRATDGNPIKTMFPPKEECTIGPHFLGEHLDFTEPIVVEGMFSLFRPFVWGFEVISPLTCRCSDLQLKNMLGRYKKLILCFDMGDRTNAGLENMRKILLNCFDVLPIEVMVLPDQIDPDEISWAEFVKCYKEKFELNFEELDMLKQQQKRFIKR